MNVNKLRSLRAFHCLTQENIAKEIGIATKTYNRKELGEVNFTVVEIIQLASILNLTLQDVDYIFFDNKLTKRISG